MMNFKLATLAGLLALGLVGTAIAQQGGAQDQGRGKGKRGAMTEPQTRADAAAKVKAKFARTDKNSDGFVTGEELAAESEARMAGMRDRNFDRMDANKDGSISRAEYDSQVMGRGRRADRAGQPSRGGQAERGDRSGWMMSRADSNGDGKMSEAEMTANTLARFDKIDTDKNGIVTPEERRASWAKMFERMGRGRAAKEERF
jgi:hypothetical protein